MVGAGLDLKTLAAAARSLDVGIVENELAAQLVVDEVHLGAEQGQLGFGVDENARAVLLDHFVEAILLARVLDRVREATAAALLDADAQSDHVGPRLHQRLDAFDRGRRERDGNAWRR